MSTTDQQYSEEVQLAASLIAGFGGPERVLRDDRPDLVEQLDRFKQQAEALSCDLKAINGHISLVTAQLLPDDELTRLAQVARDVRDDTLPEIDTDDPLTPCPSWCEMPDHSQTKVGKWHEGAITAVPTRPVEPYRTLYCEVTWTPVDGDTGPTLAISADTDGITPAQAREFAAGVLRAADLYERLAGADPHAHSGS